MILCIETATGVCSAALCNDTVTLHLREAAEGRSHAAQLTVLIRELLTEASVTTQELDAVAVSKGPGSYTGLRIGVSVAKGISYGAGIPLIGINTMTAMYYGYISKYGVPPDETLLCPMIDARRMEVFNALFTPDGKMVRSTAADIIDEASFHAELANSRVIFFGNGAAKCKGIITDSNALFEDDFTLSASYLQLPSAEALKEKRFEDTAYFEPFYLKEFLATVPKKMIP
jgi:tRNA threonylcarbamoyladenosine biosynthesis protein TsaB